MLREAFVYFKAKMTPENQNIEIIIRKKFHKGNAA
jgi:hypothetical protein